VEAEELSSARVLEPFDKKRHDRKSFSCEVESLEQYFKTRASQDVSKRVAAVFVLAEGSTVLGYYTLSSYTIDAGELPLEITDRLRLPNYPKLPATLIGRLARDEDYKGKGIGEKLLVNALGRCLENTSTVGTIAVVVEAENDKAREFYLHHGFIEFPDHPNKLFMMMCNVKAAFSEGA
jgi:GNAT superfamily N-acetyltransferase